MGVTRAGSSPVSDTDLPAEMQEAPEAELLGVAFRCLLAPVATGWRPGSLVKPPPPSDRHDARISGDLSLATGALALVSTFFTARLFESAPPSGLRGRPGPRGCELLARRTSHEGPGRVARPRDRCGRNRPLDHPNRVLRLRRGDHVDPQLRHASLSAPVGVSIAVEAPSVAALPEMLRTDRERRGSPPARPRRGSASSPLSTANFEAGMRSPTLDMVGGTKVGVMEPWASC